jgi:CheY-like chemotaxis protein
MTVSNSKMLLVEDSKFLRIATEHSLSKAGYLVSTAADGEEALQVAKEKLPDMMLPKISGPNVLKALKENPATIHIPVIVLTSLSHKNEENSSARCGRLRGAAAYFEKSALALDQNSDLLATTVETVPAHKSIKKPLIEACAGGAPDVPARLTGA